jgi:hypothetical protein
MDDTAAFEGLESLVTPAGLWLEGKRSTRSKLADRFCFASKLS